MTERRPLVRINGEFRQLPDGDSIVGADGGGVTTPIVFPIEEVILESRTWTARVSGWHRITAVGAGGAGGKVFRNATLARRILGTGGSSGGTSKKMIWLEAGQQLVITIGAGGLMNMDLPQIMADGGDGGNTTVVGPGINLLARGGKGGKAAFYTQANSSSITHTLSGVSGGTAEGGDINLQGGGSGDAVIEVISMPTNWKNSYSAVSLTGGGCVSLLRPIGTKSGLAYCKLGLDAEGIANNVIVFSMSCGSGLGGNSGDCYVTQTNSVTSIAGASSGGCGTFSGSPNYTVNIASNVTNIGPPGDGLTNFGAGASSRLLDPNGSPSRSNLTATANVPVGVSQATSNANFSMITTYAPFSGFPGMIQTLSTPVKNQAFCGGGGGPLVNASGILTTDASYTHGGSGVVIIEAPM